MPDDFYRDIHIVDEDVCLDVGLQPEYVRARACIAQDIKHMLIESGLVVEMIGERNKAGRQTSIVRMTLLVDEDLRIVPDTCHIEEVWQSRTEVTYWLTAETVRYGKIDFILFSGSVTWA